MKLGDSFDKAVDKIRIGTGATGKALEGLEEDFKNVYTSVDASIDDASTVIADLNTRTGLTGEGLQDLSIQMLQLAKITKEDINGLIPATTRMFKMQEYPLINTVKPWIIPLMSANRPVSGSPSFNNL